MRSTSRARSSTLSIGKGIAITSTPSELNGQTLAHEVRAVEGCEKDLLLCIPPWSNEQCGHTRNHIAGIHSILVFDESEAIHELDLGDLSGAMSVEVGLNISLSSYVMVSDILR
jgi:hypothetical protein